MRVITRIKFKAAEKKAERTFRWYHNAFQQNEI